MKIPRTFRIERELSEKLDKMCNRHGDLTWHVEQALTNYFEGSRPIKAVSPTELKKLHESIKKEIEDLETCFTIFWNSGIRKLNKKKAKSLFTNILKNNTDQGWSEFTEILVEDVQERIRINQLGFSQMHPTTYLNGERWKDEKVIENEKTQRSTQPRSSAVSRVREAGQRREAEIKARISELEAMGPANGDIRSSDRATVRCSNAGELETTIEGDYTRSDC